MISFLLSVVVWFCILITLAFGGAALAKWLGGKNLFFTIVEQGTEKHVMCLGKWSRKLGPGLHFFFWPFEKIYVYKFGWTGVQQDGTFEQHPKRWIDYILTKEDVYALRVKDAEDKNLVPLEWLITMTIKIVDSRKSLFEIENWLETLFNRIGPYVRDFSGLYAYEELVKGKKDGEKMELEHEIFERLSRTGIIEEVDGSGRDKRSILVKFEQDYGVHIRALEVVDIDPDVHFRELTVQKRRGEANADQAVAETTGRIKKTIAELSGVEGVSAAMVYRDVADQVKRDRAGDKGELRDVRVGSTDGTPFAQGSLSEIVGGVVASVASSWSSKDDDSGKSKKRPPKK